MPARIVWIAAVAALLLAPGAPAQESALAGSPAPKLSAGGMPEGLLTALDAIGGSGTPEGLGASWYPGRQVRNQPASLGLLDSFAGGSVPVYEKGGETLFATATARGLSVLGSNAVLPDDSARLPTQFWDVQAGGLYVGQLDGGRSWGVGGTLGSASDRPFHSRGELTANALAFYRSPSGDRDAWLYYVVSSTNGQVGRNIPVPGVAYEFTRDRIKGVVGFPFVSLTYSPCARVQAEFYYAPLTDLTARVLVGPPDGARAYGGFVWASQSYFRAGRASRDDQLFLYEKRLEGGVRRSLGPQFHVQVGGGYAFDRYFVENNGFSLSGRNRVDIGAGPYVGAQLVAHY